MISSCHEVESCCESLETLLIDEACEGGYWHGELSSSALATAVAVVALEQVSEEHDLGRVCAGVQWLKSHANSDGGWGDSPESRSNMSTTLLVWAALSSLEKRIPADTPSVARADAWLRSRIGSLDSGAIVNAVLGFYGKDRTFSAPILVMLGVCGQLGDRWTSVPQLPLEVGALPQRLFRWIRLPVVSYAIPALIAVGLARHRKAPTRLAPLRWLRNRLAARLLDRLQQLQPENGGFLEATPLTAFVVLSLCVAGLKEHPVVAAGAEFLRRSQRDDGSWPIDSNLATWVTTLAVKALAAEGEVECALSVNQTAPIREWLLGQQFTSEHFFTGSAPGGWSWTDLPGGVPDADDTAGSLLALSALNDGSDAVLRSAANGVGWLLDLQNSDGGLPTFCRGWGRLPFDRSCPDITAHALRAWIAWSAQLDLKLRQRTQDGIDRALAFLCKTQINDGSWLPLWFGSQWTHDENNPVYGTALVVDALREDGLSDRPMVAQMIDDAQRWLLAAQNPDGGWGKDQHGVSTFEETALAVAALAGGEEDDAVDRGAGWLTRHYKNPHLPAASPIGLYFASLWYSERLYPLVFGVKALRRAVSSQRVRTLACISHQPSAADGDMQPPEAFSQIGLLQPTQAPAEPHAEGVAAQSGGARGPYVPLSTTPRPSCQKHRWAQRLTALATRVGEICRLEGVA